MTSPATDAVAPVTLQGLPAVPWWTASTPWLLIAGAITLLAVTGTATYLWATAAPESRTRAVLAFRLGLLPRARRTLARLAAAEPGAHPVALMLSPGAFDRAAAQSSIPARDLARLRHRLFN